MTMTDNEIKRFLTIQSHERFANLFIENLSFPKCGQNFDF